MARAPAAAASAALPQEAWGGAPSSTGAPRASSARTASTWPAAAAKASAVTGAQGEGANRGASGPGSSGAGRGQARARRHAASTASAAGLAGSTWRSAVGAVPIMRGRMTSWGGSARWARRAAPCACSQARRAQSPLCAAYMKGVRCRGPRGAAKNAPQAHVARQRGASRAASGAWPGCWAKRARAARSRAPRGSAGAGAGAAEEAQGAGAAAGGVGVAAAAAAALEAGGAASLAASAVGFAVEEAAATVGATGAAE